VSEAFPRYVFIQKAREIGHSEEYIRETVAYSDKLSKYGLPVIFSLKHFAKILGIKKNYLNWLLTNREYQYTKFRIRKKNGTGVREIRAPKEDLKDIQSWINQNILVQVPIHDRCMSFRSGKSIKDNAQIHVGKSLLLQIDFYRFYDTISEERVYGLFRQLGYHPNLAVDLAKLTTVPPSTTYEEIINEDPHKPDDYSVVRSAYLPQGAPTSPMISNIIARSLDYRLHRLTQKMGSEYTRYADDITISGTSSTIPSIKLVSSIIKEEGFFLNHKKTHYRKKGQKQLVTGLTVTEGVHVPRILKEEIRQHLHYCLKLGPLAHLTNRGIQGKASYKDWLLGNICFIYGIEPELGERLLTDFNQIDWVL
jgi:RNA-directed DNA polymerase